MRTVTSLINDRLSHYMNLVVYPICHNTFDTLHFQLNYMFRESKIISIDRSLRYYTYSQFHGSIDKNNR